MMKFRDILGNVKTIQLNKKVMTEALNREFKESDPLTYAYLNI